MHRRQALKVVAGLALCPLCAAAGFGEEAHEGPHWSYEGASGPDNWGSLDPDYGACTSGSQQSPLNIAEPVSARQQTLNIAWRKRPDSVVNNGHTVQFNFADGGALTVDNLGYMLTQFHFHHPSEHRINGKGFAMEAQFVHAGAAGRLAVLAVFVAPGRANSVFNKIVSTMPTQAGSPVRADPSIDPNGLLPAKRAYYRYEGSLTTPPCSETVDWLVLADPIEVAEADISRFAKLYPMNARPVQNLNRRFILGSAP
jgi:carbonic anhydrase